MGKPRAKALQGPLALVAARARVMMNGQARDSIKIAARARVMMNGSVGTLCIGL